MADNVPKEAYDEMLRKLQNTIRDLKKALGDSEKKYQEKCNEHYKTITQRDEYKAKYKERKKK